MNKQIIFDWIKEGIKLNLPASNEEIFKCEDAIGFKFPKDFIEFYSLCNGFKEFAMDSKFLSLWPIEKIQSEFDPTDDFVAFSDFLINSHSIGFIKGEVGIFKEYDRSIICLNFTRFLNHWRNETYEYI